ncbi:MAG: SpoIID/LytB domain-containing protein [Oscillospiraceae bacterium]|nr:SpoIID/LytB domain-containing protein [Oscillospiraceae bacterium]
MKLKTNTILSFILAAALCFSIIAYGESAYAADSIYVNDSQNVLSGDLGSSYVVGDTGTISPAGGAYAITGGGVVQIGQSATPTPTIPSGDADGTTVSVKQQTVRVGLYYYSASRNTALTYANLENKVGSGYEFGYYDSARVFHSLGSTDVTMLTMVPNVNTAVVGGTVGCYHIQIPNAYGDFNTAKSAASQYADGFPAYINGAYYVMIGNYQSAAETNTARASLGLTGNIFTGSSRCVAVTKTNTTRILFEFDAGTSANLAVHPIASNTKAVTWFKSNAYYGDFEYYRAVSDKLTVINVLNIEDYVKGVLPYEMSSSWPAEALKAQAICARSYFATSVGKFQSYGFDLTNDDLSQVYRGTSLATASTDAAVDATSGEYVTYNGSVCSTFYFSSDGGGTEDSENIFVTALPYLRGVIDPFENDVPQSLNSRKSWTYEFTGEQLAAKLASCGYTGGAVVSAVPVYSDTNNVVKMTFSDANGNTKVLTKDSNYSVLGLPSVHYTITQSATGTFVISGGGWGHNVGMSQFGAYSMAKNYGLNYRQIIRYYFTGVSISQGIVS